MGFPCTKEEMFDLVQEYVHVNRIETPFKNRRPGEDWYRGFMKRNPELTFKKAQHLQRVRLSSRRPDVVLKFYEEWRELLDRVKIGRDTAALILNTDESGFASDPSKLRAVSRVSGGSGKHSTTVLACISADGAYLPPLIVFKGGAVQDRWTSGESFPGTCYAAAKNGWMEEPVFFNWFCGMFLNSVKSLRQETGLGDQEAVLLFDGHSSHMSLRLVETALQNRIHLVKLPSHLTDRLQPLDKTVFGPLKTMWDKELVKFGRARMGVGISQLTKAEFSGLLGVVWGRAMSAHNIRSGFASTGIFPVDPSKFGKFFRTPSETRSFVIAQPASGNTTMEPSCSRRRRSPIPKSTSQAAVPIANAQVDEETALDLRTASSFERIFLENIKLCMGNQQKNESESSRKSGTRLKQAKYGEILTTEQVKQRLAAAEDAKLKKKQPRKRSVPTEGSKCPTKRRVGNMDSDSFLACSSEEEDIPEELFSESVKRQDISAGDWVLVGDPVTLSFSTKRVRRYYAGRVTKCLEDTFEISFLRRKGGKFVFPNVRDRSEVEVDDIKKKLPPPSEKRGYFDFKIKFPRIEVL